METRIHLDDASWDIDGQDSAPEFNAATIRRDVMQFKQNAARVEENETAIYDGSTSELDASVSTLHLDGSSLSSSVSESPFQFRTPLNLPSPNEYPRLPLEQHSDYPSNGPSHTESASEHTPGDIDAAYPAVHIDVSQPLPKRVSIAMPDDDDSQYRISVGNDDGLNTFKPIYPEQSKSTTSASQSLSLQSDLDSSQASPRPPRTAGPSTFQKIVSKTRPHFLPPKNQKEDRKHLADWEAMMKESRAAGTVVHLAIITILNEHLIVEERRRKALQERRLARELKIEQSMHIWEKEIIPDWRIVHRNSTLRKLWWNGIPTKLRSMVWERAAGNALALNRGNLTPEP